MLCCNTLVFSHFLYVCIIIIVSDQRELRLSMLCSRRGGISSITTTTTMCLSVYLDLKSRALTYVQSM